MKTQNSNDPTIQYYNENTAAYFSSTVGLPVADREIFLSYLPNPARILDAGCGSGRDSLAFLEAGHKIDAFDASSGLAAAASKLTGLPVAVQRFQDFSSIPRFHGVWAMASLVHLPKADIVPSLTRLTASLLSGGYLFCCFKNGSGERLDDGRHFTDMTPEDLRGVARQSGLQPVRSWSTESERAGKKSVWNNLIAQVQRPIA